MTAEARRGLRERLKLREGTGQTRRGRLLPYRCPAGKLTIGYGRNIEDIGISPVEAEFLLDNDIDAIERSLRVHLPWFAQLDDVRQGALIDMGMMGVPKLLGFKKMLAALERGDYATAEQEAHDSKWATDVGPVRSGDVGRMLRTGEL